MVSDQSVTDHSSELTGCRQAFDELDSENFNIPEGRVWASLRPDGPNPARPLLDY